MEIPRKIFKTYDIRGLVDTEITPVFAHGLGRAFATFIIRETGNTAPVIAIGRDMRPSSLPYETALINGLLDQGAKVVQMGLVSTPAFYYGVSHVEADGGIQVSASHNPAPYNGFKLVRRRALPISGGTGIQAIADIMEQDDYFLKEKITAPVPTYDTAAEQVAAPGPSFRVVTGIPAKQVMAEITFANVGALPRYNVVADSANGMGAQFLDLAFAHAEFHVTQMNWDFDGTFPNHEADPYKVENTADLRKKVVELGADIGIATDGDGDRIFFIDDQGEIVDPAIIRGLVGQAMLRRFPGATVAYDVRPGKITEDMIRAAGGTPLVTPVGHALIKESMIKHDAVFAGESSGHFYMKMPEGVYEAPVATMLMVIAEMVREGKKLSEIVAPLKKYSHSGEINFKVEDKDGAIARLQEHFNEGVQSYLDGLLVTYPNFWFSVRSSNTESLLRLNLEATDVDTMEAKRAEITKIIAG